MNFKFTPRELRMLVALLVIAILAGFYQFVYMPVTADRNIAQTVHDDIIAEESAILENILSKEVLKEVIHSLQRESKILTKQLPPQIDQEYIVMDVIDIFSENNAELLSFGFNGEEFLTKSEGVNSVDDALALYEESFNENNEKIDDLKNMFNNQPKEDDTEVEEEESPVKNLELSITCAGLYKNIQGVIRKIGELDNIVVVKSIALSKDSTSMNLILATLTLEFPYYPDNSHYELEEWESLDLKEDKTDPFNYYIRGSLLDPNVERTAGSTNLSSILSTFTNQQEPTKVETQIDFYISAKPKSSDDFAYTIGKKNDARNKLHSDLDVEELHLHFEDIEGKPAFNMGTILRPVSENGDSEVFTPLSSKINVEVISQARINDKDINKAVLKITNTSSKEVVVTIRNDDKSMPRITVVKEGRVTVK